MDNLGLRVTKNAEIEGALNVGSGATIDKSLRLPLTAPTSRVVGDIWYDPNITSPGGSSGGGGDVGKQVTVIQHTPNEVDLYDGSTRVATFKMDNSVDKIVYDSSTKTIKVPNGVILANILDSNSITLEKNGNANSLKISVKDAYINTLADSRASLAIAPVSKELTNLKGQCSVDINNLTGSIASTNSRIDSEKASLSSSISSTNTRIEILETKVNSKLQEANAIHSEINTHLNNIFESIDATSERINGLETDQNAKYSALSTSQDEILKRLLAIEGAIENQTNLQATVEAQNASLSQLESRVAELERKLTPII